MKCLKHPFHDDHTTGTCTYKGRPCKICSQDGHHFLLCPKASKTAKTSSNSTTMTAINGDGMLPVLLQMQYVFTPGGSGVGTLLDLASTDDYVTHRYARKNKLHGADVDLIIEGMGGEEKFYKTKLYRVPIKHGDVVYEIPCYGMEKITSVAAPPEIKSYRRLCKKLKVGAAKVRRPNSIDLLISMRQNFLHPKPVRQMNGITLYGGPLGMVIGGSEASLVFETPVKSYPLSVAEVHASSTAYAKTMKAAVKEATLGESSDIKKENVKEELKDDGFENECDQCNFKTEDKQDLLKHKMSSYEAVGFRGDQCTYITSCKEALKPHMQVIHGGKKFECGTFTFEASTISELKYHTKSEHEGYLHECEKDEKDELDCSADGKVQSKESNEQFNDENPEQKVKVENVFFCDKCSYTATKKGTLRSHERTNHEGIRFPCDQCEFSALTQQSV